jgi:TMEM175 potassium channel family protein
MNDRLEMFSDGVFAIAITLLILDLKVPPVESVHSVAEVWRDILRLWPSVFALSLSFVIILIAWIGHHNMLKGVDKTSPQFQVSNGFFMFTIILLPFSTAFMAEYLDTPYAQPAILVYCLNSLLHNFGWNVLHRSILKPVPLLKDIDGLDLYKKASRSARYGFVLYTGIALLAWWLPYVALAICVLTWLYWLYLSISIGPPERELKEKGVESLIE